MKSASLFLLLAVCGCAFGIPSSLNENDSFDSTLKTDWRVFNRFVQKYNKMYDDVEEMKMRFDEFRVNYKKIVEHNMMPHQNFTLRVNEFADMTQEEFRLYMTGFRDHSVRLPSETNGCSSFVSTKSVNLPNSVDWRDHQAVTPIKNQGQCGSCWSFSATGSMEGAWAIKSGNLVSLSEQQLVDCSGSFGNQGCNGGLMDYAFEYAMENGMCTESEEPYEGRDDNCKQCTPSVTVKGCVDVTANNQEELKEAVSRQPVSVAIEADTTTFQFYNSGVLTSESCGTNLDHGVLAVGYGTENGNDYWLVKNSWGNSWGDNGYVKILRTDSKSDPGICGIAMSASYPTV